MGQKGTGQRCAIVLVSGHASAPCTEVLKELPPVSLRALFTSFVRGVLCSTPLFFTSTANTRAARVSSFLPTTLQQQLFFLVWGGRELLPSHGGFWRADLPKGIALVVGWAVSVLLGVAPVIASTAEES